MTSRPPTPEPEPLEPAEPATNVVLPLFEPLPAPEPPIPPLQLPPFEPLLLPESPHTPLREWFTFAIALVLTGGFVAIIVIIVSTWTVRIIATDDVVKLLTTVSGIMSGLVGAVAGYYFRGREEAARRGG